MRIGKKEDGAPYRRVVMAKDSPKEGKRAKQSQDSEGKMSLSSVRRKRNAVMAAGSMK